jgi:hypothetical protein
MEITRSRESLLNNLYALHLRGTERAGGALSESIQMANTLDEERDLLGFCAFRSVEIFYKRYGLSGLIAIK